MTTVRVIEFTNADRAAIASATKILVARYRDYVDYADVQSELVLWLLENYYRADKWRENYSESHAERTLVKALRNAGERYCRKEKSEAVGYSPEDEFFYSIPMVADLLQLYLDTDWMIPSGLNLTKTSGGKPASEGGNLIAMVADVGRAYEQLPENDRALLASVYDGRSVVSDAITVKALMWGITHAAADARIRRIVGRLRAKLGGASPYARDREDDQ